MWLLPFLIAAVALALRLYGVAWDQGNFFHPDERSIYMRADCMYETLADNPGWEGCANRDFPLDEPGIPSPGVFFDADRSPLNPHWFPLGTVLIYALVLVRAVLGLFMDGVGLHDLSMAGRTLGALADAGSVLMLFALGQRLYGRPVGLLAAGLSAFTVVSIQLAHFYRPEPFIVLTALASFWFMLNVLERGRLRDHVWLGVVIGLSFALKPTSLPLLVPLALTYGILAWRAWSFYRLMIPAVAVVEVWARSVVAAAVTLAVFAVLQPYAFLDFVKFAGDLGWEADIARTAGLVPYTLQYVGTPVGWYELRQTTVWALGLPLGLVAWGGLVLTLARSWSRPRTGDLLLLAWVVPTLLALALFEVKFLRYIAPVLPVMVLLGSRWIVAAYQSAAPRSVGLSRLAMAGGLLVFLATAFYGLAFVRIYSSPHPAVQASEWVNANVQTGATVLTDNHWDEGFPDLGRYRVHQLPMYEGDRFEKFESLSADLAEADYLMVYSNRPFGSIARLPKRYPLSSSYYQLLFDGGLGYELERAFASYPSLLGVTFAHDPFTRAGVTKPEELPGVDGGGLTLRLGYADENVTNYDHPLVLVFRNQGRLSESDVLDRIVSYRPDKAPEGLLLSEETWAVQRAGGTWTGLFSEGGLAGRAPWLLWLILVEAIALAALPLAVTIFRWLPDRGVLLARPLGLLLVAWLTWMGASAGWWSFSRTSVLGSLLVLALVSGVLLYRRRETMLPMAKRHWRYLAWTEVLFLVAFFAFLAIRAANPDLGHPWRGGEKFMELSYLTAIVKSTTMPPFDPWYAGGYLNYYYFGLFIVATLIKTTSIVPTVAFNLAVPLMFALTATGAYAVGCNLAEALRRARYPRLSARSTVAAGLGAVLMVTVLGNLEFAGQLLLGAWSWVTGAGFPTFGTNAYWASRDLLGPSSGLEVTEFPFWSFLFADLHAHLIAIPFIILALGLALNLALSGARSVRWAARVPAVLLLALALGALVPINAWAMPAIAAIGLAVGAVLLVTRARTLKRSQLVQWLAWAALLGSTSYALFLPFHINFESPFGGVRLSEWRTAFWQYLGVHGAMFFVVGSWLVVEGYRRLGPWWRGRMSPGPGAASVELLRPTSRLPLTGRGIVVVLAALGAAAMALTGWETVGPLLFFLAIGAGLVVWWMVRPHRAEAPGQLFLLAMVGVALGIGVGVDVVTVEPDIDRLNTVFKLYLVSWVLLGIASAVALWLLWASGAIRWRRPKHPLVRGWLVLLGLLVLSSAVFPVLGTRARLADRFQPLPLTLDGAAYHQTAVFTDPGPSRTGREPNARYALAADAEALEYMRRHISGSPVVLEAVTDRYLWTPRVATYTGLPVVVGWEWHQTQQRNFDRSRIFRRIRDVDAMYTTQDRVETARLLDKYEVEYIYVGSVERLYYPESGLRKFEGMARLGAFFQSEDVTIYHVMRDARTG